MKLVNDSFGMRLRARLLDRADAIDAVRDQFGISLKTAQRFRLGLSEPYPKVAATNSDSLIYKDVLVAPLRSEDGRFYTPYTYQSLCGITVDRRLHPIARWCTGPSRSYYSQRTTTRSESILVCARIDDVWALSELIEGSRVERELLVIAPTPSVNADWPAEWQSEAFWASWASVLIGLPEEHNGAAADKADQDAKVLRLAALAKREVRRLPPLVGTSWTAACKEGIRADALREAIQKATVLTERDVLACESSRYASAESKDLSSAYHAGHLYEAIRVLEQEGSADCKLERYKDLVVRSDRSLHSVQEMPSPAGTSRQQRVIRLVPDGTPLQRVPVPSPYGTWRWPSVQAYVFQRSMSPPLGDLLGRLTKHLRACVWLPNSADYTLLSCAAAATYCQQMFDAVPLILVNGVKESGKTELGIAMSEVCANSPGPVGVVSAATMARLIDMTRGFVVIDDLERVMAKRSGESVFSDLVQALKLSYKKQSALKLWTDTNNGMRVDRLNFFGIKLINNTGGVDDILGSRMLTVATRPMPKGIELPRHERLNSEECAELRDDLHTWAFTHVDDIRRTYLEIFPNSTTRAEEIAAPIRVIAQLSGVTTVQDVANGALRTPRTTGAVTPVELMDEAIQCILVVSIREARQLRTALTVEEVRMRMLLLEGHQFGKSHTTDIADVDRPEWIGRLFKQLFAKPESVPERFQMHGRGMRAWTLDHAVMDRAATAAGVALKDLHQIPDPKVFCQDCASCDYVSVCSMQQEKAARARRTRKAIGAPAGAEQAMRVGNAAVSTTPRGAG